MATHPKLNVLRPFHITFSTDNGVSPPNLLCFQTSDIRETEKKKFFLKDLSYNEDCIQLPNLAKSDYFKTKA